MLKQFNDILAETGEVGTVVKMNYPIVVVEGLPHVRLHELVQFEQEEMGEVIALDRDFVHIALFARTPVHLGTKVARLQSMLQVPVGGNLTGLLLDPLGTVISGDPAKLANSERRSIYSAVPPLLKRRRVAKQFFTGITSVDLLIPIGKGQKEILIGDRRVGKRTLALRAALTAARRGEMVVFCCIGQTIADVRSIYDYFVQYDMLDSVVMIATTAHDSPYLIYRAPYTAMVHAEYFRDQGKDVLIVLDDLSTHAQFYRELSLLAERFPGRESYPGDIFYVHSTILERAGNFVIDSGEEYSITCLPLVHIHESDITSYIATNSIGISDGHLLLDRNLLLQGIRPPIHIGLSVTRAGKQTQSLILRDVNRIMTSFLSKYDKVRNYSQFGSELNKNVKEVIKRGNLINMFFEQVSMIDSPLEVDLLVVSIIWSGYLDSETVLDFQTLYSRLTDAYNAEQNRSFFSGIMQLPSFQDLLDSITHNREAVLSLCGLTK
jgi:F-type H+/Na+-transporting ATPase subunit alpha